MKDGRIVDATPAAEGTWVQSWGIETPCKYNVYGKSESKNTVTNILNKYCGLLRQLHIGTCLNLYVSAAIRDIILSQNEIFWI